MLAIGVEAACADLGFECRPVAYVEREAFPCAILGDRGEQEALGAAPVFPDLAGFDGRRFRGLVDLIVAGLPCQPYSVAGKREGWDDKRSIGEGDGPIVQFLRIVEEVLPALVFMENVPPWVTARDQWFRPVGERLSELGYRVEKPLFLAARDVGASHERERVFILAHHEHARFGGRSATHDNDRGDAQRHDADGCYSDVAIGTGGGLGIGRQSSGSNVQPDGCDDQLADAGRARDGTHEPQPIGRSGNEADACACREELADPARDGGDGPHRKGGSGRGVCEAGGGVANAGHGLIPQPRQGPQGRDGTGPAEPPVGSPTGTQRAGGGERGERRAPQGSGARGPTLALTSSPRLEGHEQHAACDGDRGGAQAHGPATELRDDELFAPGPSDPRWGGIIAAKPWLAPATQPGVRVWADGASFDVDESRRDQLRAVGNGAVPLCAALAFVVLAREAGIVMGAQFEDVAIEVAA